MNKWLLPIVFLVIGVLVGFAISSTGILGQAILPQPRPIPNPPVDLPPATVLYSPTDGNIYTSSGPVVIPVKGYCKDDVKLVECVVDATNAKSGESSSYSCPPGPIDNNKTCKFDMPATFNYPGKVTVNVFARDSANNYSSKIATVYACIYADVTMDANVNCYDYNAIVAMNLGKITPTVCSDLNKNGIRADNSDVNLEYSYLKSRGLDCNATR